MATLRIRKRVNDASQFFLTKSYAGDVSVCAEDPSGMVWSLVLIRQSSAALSTGLGSTSPFQRKGRDNRILIKNGSAR